MAPESPVTRASRFYASASSGTSRAASEHDSTSSWYGINGRSEPPNPWIGSSLEGYRWPVFGPYRVNKTQWVETEDYWPRRLLHIPTMTSYERGDGHTYRNEEKPRYSVLSYTWGRFQTPCRQSGCSLTIHNVPWEIPSIHPTHFTVDAFHNVLNKIRLGTDWVWVDIACIDQEDIKVKMDEIGRQAAIFREAALAYVWLSRIPLQPCFEAMGLLDEVEVGPDLGLKENDRNLEILEGAFGLILSDPWFSSLWTLQEIMMRNDALVISSEGDIVTYCEQHVIANAVGEFNFPRAETSKHPMAFNKLSSVWRRHVNDLLLPTAIEVESVIEDSTSTGEGTISRTGLSVRLRELAETLEKSGLTELNSNNPHVQYGAAKYRKTTYAEDRIYAITQIYGLAVGQTLRPGDQPTPDELRTEFGLAINALSPVQGQMFVHTSSPCQSRSWCITEDSHVPMTLRDCDDIKDHSSVASEADGSVTFSGQACSLTSFLELHKERIDSRAHPIALQLQFHMDNDVARLMEPKVDPSERWKWLMVWQSVPGIELSKEEFEYPKKMYELGHVILDQFGCDNLLVLRLGDVQNFSGPSGYKDDGIDHIEERVGRRMFRWGRKNVALLLHKLSDGSQAPGRASYARLGVCTWDTTAAIDDFRGDAPEGYDWEDMKSFIVDAYEKDAWSYSEDTRAIFQDRISVKVV